MIKVILIIIFTLFIFTIKGQSIDKIYYLLGTQDDYLGRERFDNKYDIVISLHESQFAEIERIEEVTGLKFEKLEKQDNCSNCHEFFNLKSENDVKIINSFYKFRKFDYLNYFPLRGTLKCRKLLKADENEKLSFIAGLFLFCGEMESNYYRISLANSPERFKCVEKVIIKLGSTIISKKKYHNIPNVYILDFTPSERLKKIIDYEIERKKTLANKIPGSQ